jgi:hypothetical protein
VGLIYGPSGCGKTSLVRAGIIPHLDPGIDVIYIQASLDDTERRLTQPLLTHSYRIDGPRPEKISVIEAFTMVRRQRKKKVVIFIDQFEQWLFTHSDSHKEALTQALRQCDGEFLQCILMVRDDFWMGVTRLMQSLDLPISENVNSTVVDLFDVRHARKVLRTFGEAYGRLPSSNQELTQAQTRFLDAAISYLNSDGRIICVQLSLLTEMLKHRPWEESTGLFHDGGAGIGMQFLESTFESELSSRRIRLHASGAIGVLKALLPDSGSRIKGALRTGKEMFEASGYSDRGQFSELITILDRELHLITPSDRIDGDSLRSGSGISVTDLRASGFQLTHDFLIAPVRQWVDYRHRSTKEGKARLRLDENAELYKARPKKKSLPSMTEYFGIRRLVNPKIYTEPQRRVMNEARKHQGRILCSWGALLLFFAISGWLIFKEVARRGDIQATQSEFARLIAANMDEATTLAERLRRSDVARHEAEIVLKDPGKNFGHQVRAGLVLRESDTHATGLLKTFLRDAPPDEVLAIARRCDLSVGGLNLIATQTWQDPTATPAARIRAAALIANDPLQTSDNELQSNTKTRQFVDRLIPMVLAENPIWIKLWGDAFRPFAGQIKRKLESLIRENLPADQSINKTCRRFGPVVLLDMVEGPEKRERTL